MRLPLSVSVCAAIVACSPCVAQLQVVPSLCGAHGAYDSHRDLVVTFDNSTSTTRLFDGAMWQAVVSPVVPPTPLWFVYDAGRRRVLDVDFLDVWEWDGHQWTIMGPSSYAQPSSSYFVGAIAYDAHEERVTMLALHPSGVDAELRDWDGSGWTTRANSAIVARPGPFAQYIYHAMEYDSLRRRLVLFGRTEVLNSGSIVASLPLTWEWDRQAGWVQFPASGIIGFTTMWFDNHRGRMMRHEWSTTFSAINLRDANGTWQPVGATGLSSTPIGGHSYDSKRNRLYKNWNGGGYLTSTHPAEYEQHGSGCAAPGSPKLGLSQPWSRAWAGQSLSVTVMPNVAAVHAVAVLATGLSDTAWGSAPLPLALDAFGMPGCTLRVAPDVLDLGTGGNGGITFQLAVPANPALHGAAFWQQAFVLDAFANAAGLRASNSMRATVGQMQ